MTVIADTVLLVDDEPMVLAGLQRSLFGRYPVLTATSGEQALALMAKQPIAVVISDMRMPGMDGASFLAQVQARFPDTVRMLLTGYADLDTAVAAVNEGAIFRFLHKPCPTGVLVDTLAVAQNRYRTQQIERNLLQTTVLRMVHVLSEVLGLAAPLAFRRAAFVEACVREALPQLHWEAPWRYGVAAALCQIGWIGVSLAEAPQAEAEGEAAEAAGRLLEQIPRLESVAGMVRYQHRGAPAEAPQEVRQGAALLRAALTLEALPRRQLGTAAALEALRASRPGLPSEIIEVLRSFRDDRSEFRVEHVRDLQPGWMLDQDVRNHLGRLVLAQGITLTDAAISALQRVWRQGAMDPQIRIRLKPKTLSRAASPATG